MISSALSRVKFALQSLHSLPAPMRQSVIEDRHASLLRHEQLAEHLHPQVRKKFPVAANQNAVAVAMDEHPQAVKLPEVHDGPEMLRDVHCARSSDIVDALAKQFFLRVSHRGTEFLRDLFESPFEIEHDPKPAVRLRRAPGFRC